MTVDVVDVPSSDGVPASAGIDGAVFDSDVTAGALLLTMVDGARWCRNGVANPGVDLSRLMALMETALSS